jgi:hypothetical protein
MQRKGPTVIYRPNIDFRNNLSLLLSDMNIRGVTYYIEAKLPIEMHH